LGYCQSFSLIPKTIVFRTSARVKTVKFLFFDVFALTNAILAPADTTPTLADAPPAVADTASAPANATSALADMASGVADVMPAVAETAFARRWKTSCPSFETSLS
jgi:hypothetical protein